MLRKLRLLYYNNKEKIWIVIGMIIFIVAIIQIVNHTIRQNREEELSNSSNTQYVAENQTYLPSTTTSIINDSSRSKEDVKEDTDLIEQFVEYGNNNDVEGAYNLLSQDCKDEMFSTIDRFYNNYFGDIFTEKKSYDLETWVNYGRTVTYRIKYLNDIMATGTIDEEFIQDYITVVEENDEKKLNLNQFIQKSEMDENVNKNDLEVSVTNRYSYYDYEEYEFTFTNNSDKQITIDTKDNTETVYVEDENNVRYTWYGNEVPNEYLTLNPGESRTYRIKFNKLYNPDRKDKTICFKDMSIDGEEFDLEINV